VIIVSPVDIAVQRIQIVNYKNSFYIPVVFHNLSSYDAYFIIKEIAIAYDGHVNVVLITKEKYISLTKHVDEHQRQKWKEFSEKR